MVPILLFALAALSGVAPAMAPQESPYRPLKVESCVAADSVLGPLGDDRRGRVRGFYDATPGRTHLTTGTLGGSPPNFSMGMHYDGQVPLAALEHDARRYVVMTFTVYVRGRQGRDLVKSGAPTALELLLDDSVTVQVSGVQLGLYTGPPEATTIPVSLPIPYEKWPQIVRAGRVEVRIGDRNYRPSGGDRRDLRALFRVAMCTGVGRR